MNVSRFDQRILSGRLFLGVFLCCVLTTTAMANEGLSRSIGQATAPLTGPPTAAEIQDAITPARVPREFVAKPEDQVGMLGRRIHEFLGIVCDAGVTRKPVVTWRMLILFYPNTDSDYRTLEGEVRHFTGSLAADQVKLVERALSEFPALVKWHTGGLCDLQLTLRTIPRPVTFSSENAKRYGFQYPFTRTDCKPEMDQFDNPKHDSVIVVYHPGPIPQDLRGSGGGGLGGTDARINFGGDGNWTKATDENLGTFIHEWMHGLDGYFGSQGYRVEALHSLYAASYQRRWHSPVMQGRVLDINEKAYGYSRAAWLSGPPTKRAVLPPVQPTFPVTGSKLAVSRPIRFEWANTAAPSGYRLLIFPEGAYAVPLRTISTLALQPHATVSDLAPGKYVFTVLALDGEKRSIVGDAVPFSVVPEASLEPIKVSRVSHGDLVADGRAVPLVISAWSPAGIARVNVSFVLPDGTTMTSFLRRRSPNENESTYIGDIWLPPIESTAQMKGLIRILVVDHAGRTASGEPAAVLIQPNRRKGFEKPGGQVPIQVTLPSSVLPTHITSPLTKFDVKFVGPTLAQLRGNAWMELEAPNGNKRWIAIEDRRWDDFPHTERPAYFRFPYDAESANQTWTATFCYRDPEGIVSRVVHKLSFLPATLDIPLSPSARTPVKTDGITVEGFTVKDGKWEMLGQGVGLVKHPIAATAAYRWRVRASAKNDIIVFARHTPIVPQSRTDMEGLSVIIGGWNNSLNMIRWEGRDIGSSRRYRIPNGQPVDVIVTRNGNQVVVHVDGQYLMHGFLPGDAAPHTMMGVHAGYGGEQKIESVEFTPLGG